MSATKSLLDWIDARFPLTKLWNEHLAQYYAPKNLNFWYFFGSLALLVLVIQFVSGIFLAMNYKPDAGLSYRGPRELLWIIGMLIYVALMAEAFMGYLLPWGQMSYWGAQVIISLFGAIPYFGEDLALWIRGDYVVSDATLNRFFAFHVIAVPLVLLALVAIVIFYIPEMGGYFLEHDNFVPADPLKTPEHIKPLWYFTPFYAILRAVPNKFLGVVAMGAAIFVLFLLPWLDRSPVKSIRYKGILSRIALAVFVVSFVALAWLGTQPATPTLTMFARLFSVLYFAFFLLMPIYTRIERTRPVPERVTFK